MQYFDSGCHVIGSTRLINTDVATDRDGWCCRRCWVARRGATLSSATASFTSPPGAFRADHREQWGPWARPLGAATSSGAEHVTPWRAWHASWAPVPTEHSSSPAGLCASAAARTRGYRDGKWTALVQHSGHHRRTQRSAEALQHHHRLSPSYHGNP